LPPWDHDIRVMGSESSFIQFVALQPGTIPVPSRPGRAQRTPLCSPCPWGIESAQRGGIRESRSGGGDVDSVGGMCDSRSGGAPAPRPPPPLRLSESWELGAGVCALGGGEKWGCMRVPRHLLGYIHTLLVHPTYVRVHHPHDRPTATASTAEFSLLHSARSAAIRATIRWTLLAASFYAHFPSDGALEVWGVVT
jgi:hypothetical protein